VNVDYKVIKCYVLGHITGRWYTIIEAPELASEKAQTIFLKNLGVKYAEIHGSKIKIAHYITEKEIKRAYNKTIKQISMEEYEVMQ